MGCLLAREIKKLKSAVLVNDSVLLIWFGIGVGIAVLAVHIVLLLVPKCHYCSSEVETGEISK